MKYKVETGEYLKRERWFINSEFGIAVSYFWRNKLAHVTLSTDSIESGCESELDELLKSSTPVASGSDFEISIAYPFPWFYVEPNSAVQWMTPAAEALGSHDFRLVVSASYVFQKASSLQKAKRRNDWSTLDSDFKWAIDSVAAYDTQDCEEFQKIAATWNSNLWKSDEELESYLKSMYDMNIEDDHYIFYNPTISTL